MVRFFSSEKIKIQMFLIIYHKKLTILGSIVKVGRLNFLAHGVELFYRNKIDSLGVKSYLYGRIF
jgi:hypothetical protein